MPNRFESLGDKITELVQQTLTESNHASAPYLGAMLNDLGGVTGLDPKERDMLVGTLKSIHADKKLEVKDEVRDQALALSLLVGKGDFLDESDQVSVEPSTGQKWLDRAGTVLGVGVLGTAAAAAGAGGAVLLGDANLGAGILGSEDVVSQAWNATGDGLSNLDWSDVAKYGGTAVAGGAAVMGISKLRNRMKKETKRMRRKKEKQNDNKDNEEAPVQSEPEKRKNTSHSRPQEDSRPPIPVNVPVVLGNGETIFVPASEAEKLKQSISPKSSPKNPSNSSPRRSSNSDNIRRGEGSWTVEDGWRPRQ